MARLKMCKKHLEVKDDKVHTVWTCEECSEVVWINPDFFQDNGTPMCCDVDMVYDRTFVEIGENDESNIN